MAVRSGPRRKGRELAMKLLYQRQLTKDTVGRLCASFEEFRDAPENSREFARELALGVEAHLGEIDARIKESLVGWEFDRLAAIDAQVLRVATFELLHCADIDANVSIDEAIELSRQFSTGESSKFVNGVLGAIAAKHAPQKLRAKTP